MANANILLHLAYSTPAPALAMNNACHQSEKCKAVLDLHVLWRERASAPMSTQAMLVEAMLIEPA